MPVYRSFNQKNINHCKVTKHLYLCIVARKTDTEMEYEYTENAGMYEDIPETPNTLQLSLLFQPTTLFYLCRK